MYAYAYFIDKVMEFFFLSSLYFLSVLLVSDFQQLNAIRWSK